MAASGWQKGTGSYHLIFQPIFSQCMALCRGRGRGDGDGKGDAVLTWLQFPPNPSPQQQRSRHVGLKP